MMKHDYELHVYCPEGPDIEGATLHQCLTDGERTELFGEDDPNRLPNWPTDEQTSLFNQRVIESLKPEPHDLILLSGGWTHRVIAEAFPKNIRCEPFIGYYGVMGGMIWGAYESYFHMAQVYMRKEVNDIRWFDRVIHPFYDQAEFPITNNGSGDYLLFLGRLVQRKGPHIASEIARATGIPLKVAGAGGKQVGKDIVAPEITIRDAEYLGPVGVEERAKLLSGAKAVLFPTTYAEPGGNVAIEAMACGTPVIASDFGVATETVPERFRFRTLRQAVNAVKTATREDKSELRKYCRSRFSLDAIKQRYVIWFDDLQTLFQKGWYQ
jgi:glycosyltransferase involved in cell wall biosynthesis